MNTACLDSVVLDGAPSSGALSKTYVRGAYAVNVRTRTYVRGAVAQAKQSRTYTRGAVAQGGSTKFYSRGAVAVTPYRDNAPWNELVGDNLTQPIDLNAIGHWSTFSRPTVTSYTRPVVGLNQQTGKVEYWDPIAGIWKNYDGSPA